MIRKRLEMRTNDTSVDRLKAMQSRLVSNAAAARRKQSMESLQRKVAADEEREPKAGEAIKPPTTRRS